MSVCCPHFLVESCYLRLWAQHRGRTCCSQRCWFSLSRERHFQQGCKTCWDFELVSFYSDWGNRCKPVNRDTASASDHHQRLVLWSREVQLPQESLLHIIEDVSVHGVSRPFSFQLWKRQPLVSLGVNWINFYLEDDHSAVVSGGKEVEGGVSSQHPKALVLSSEGIEARPLGHVPHPDAFVLRVGENQLLPWVE